VSCPKSPFVPCETELARGVEIKEAGTVRRGAASVDGELKGAVVNEDALCAGATDCADGIFNSRDGPDAWIGVGDPPTAVKEVGEVGVPTEGLADGETEEV
jgi:hypothetical protein